MSAGAGGAKKPFVPNSLLLRGDPDAPDDLGDELPFMDFLQSSLEWIAHFRPDSKLAKARLDALTSGYICLLSHPEAIERHRALLSSVHYLLATIHDGTPKDVEAQNETYVAFATILLWRVWFEEHAYFDGPFCIYQHVFFVLSEIAKQMAKYMKSKKDDAINIHFRVLTFVQKIQELSTTGVTEEGIWEEMKQYYADSPLSKEVLENQVVLPFFAVRDLALQYLPGECDVGEGTSDPDLSQPALLPGGFIYDPVYTFGETDGMPVDRWLAVHDYKTPQHGRA